MILEKIVETTKERVAKLQKQIPMQEMRQRAMQTTSRLPDFAFEKALHTEDIALICEVKKASPSKGLIAPHFPYMDIALEYERAGANAVSVLTEPVYFLGDDKYLTEIGRTISLPLLRKDFTVSEYQIYEAKAIGADAVLLICSVLDTVRIREYIAVADSFGLSCLVEAHDEREVESALHSGARVIGVNNRNLKTFTVDIENSIRLRGLVPPDILFVSESGIHTAQDVERLRHNGVNAALIGEAFMTSADKKAKIAALRGKSDDKNQDMRTDAQGGY